jgi:2'-5' RNA ligase
LTPSAIPRAMLSLHAALGAGLERLQFATEKRPLRPHVTLARHAIGSSAPEPMTPVPWRVRHYALVQSLPAARQYVVLRDFR